MTERPGEQLPLARREGLLIENLPDEVLVYDLDKKRAHCLNQTAALIWNHCDGTTSVEAMTTILQDRSGARVEEDVVWFGLDQLGKARLIDGPLPTRHDRQRMSRRQLIKTIGLAASIPLVVSILAPQASAALSCAHPTCIPACVGLCTCTAGNCQ